MKYASVCSGIEAATVAWDPLGWDPVWFSEIEKFPCAVLKHHYPYIPNLGDMETVNERDFRGEIDLLVGGTPCQAFSVAGLRGGLQDARGNLALAFMRLVDSVLPRYVLWENVPGVLSSNEGRDFGAIVGALAKLGYGWAYRVLDAQYFGVPQRRRRVFLVGCLGDDGSRARSILFDAESLSGNPPPSRETKSDVAGTAEASLGRGRGEGTPVAALTATGVGACGADDNQAQTCHLVAFDTTHITSSVNRSNPKPGDPCHPLAAGAHPPAVAYRTTGNDGVYETGDRTGALNCATDPNQHIIAYQCHGSNVGPMGHLRAGNGNESGGVPFIGERMAARRLTPRECERLQGFPDDYTNIPYGRPQRPGQICPDGPRYRAIGNSMAVPCMRWIGERIEQELIIHY